MTWLPDGAGLPEGAAELIGDKPVHLRLIDTETRLRRAACGDQALGGWWTGEAAEVTCRACEAFVHA